MKYKKHLATGALAISLLVGGSNVFASTPQDIGIKNSQQVYQKQNKNSGKSKIKNGRSNIVGTIDAITSTGFNVEIKNAKTNTPSSVDVQTDSGTVYSKNGIKVDAFSISSGQKVIVSGTLDKTTNIITAKTVKIVK